MSDDLEKLIDAIDTKRATVIRKIEKLHAELKGLDFEKQQLYVGGDLPTEPGWYLTAENTPARLDEHGTWDDGWGNSGPDYGPAWHPLPLTRLVPKENPDV